MKISMILNVVLVIALVFLCYKLALAGDGKVDEQDCSEVVINNILNRTSVRSYEDRAVESEKVEKLLRAGMAAPTAANKQPWHFIVVTDKNQLKKLSEANRIALQRQRIFSWQPQGWDWEPFGLAPIHQKSVVQPWLRHSNCQSR